MLPVGAKRKAKTSTMRHRAPGGTDMPTTLHKRPEKTEYDEFYEDYVGLVPA